jgi:hypothetical protein
MRVAVVFPSCNPERAATATERWAAQGYEVLILVEPAFACAPAGARIFLVHTYPGYFTACNFLARAALEDGCEIVVCIGDDMDPDPKLRAAEIGARFLERFPDGFGVMQPIGDKLDGTDRICGSPWLGRAWVERAYQGAGPLFGAYMQFFGDEELFNVSRKLGVLWQAPEFTQYHHHWIGGRQPMQPYQKANSDRWWKHDEAIFRPRKREGFPGHEPLVVVP